ncbi:hypothetical protein LSUE1_G007151 [Lachnellula suecica]|uniref:Uncharacterized protein n=1 Tax=Lachnellula suecica TaxID=602035 RepID=A0A8T9BYG8_9HELO|nr:hypothetical protein LSUE1_G007151 [Lachnellula suecica]
MAQIYTGASRGTAWLVRQNQEDFAQAADLINLLGGGSTETRYHIRARPQCPWGPPIWVNKARNDKLSTDSVTLPGGTNHHLGWLAWHRLWDRTYWSRLRIIQELILPPELVLVCGNVQLHWEALSYVCSEIHGPRPGSTEKANGEPVHPSHRPKMPPRAGEKHDEPVTPAYLGVPFRIYQRRPGVWGDRLIPSSSLFEQFILFKDAKCTEVKDRIFGLLGISPESCQDSIQVDYGTSRIDLALAVIDHDERVHQAFRAGLSSSKTRADSLIEGLECQSEAQRIVAAIEAFDSPL